jgi:hypothetical protein
MGRVLKLVFMIGTIGLLWWLFTSDSNVEVEYAE